MIYLFSSILLTAESLDDSVKGGLFDFNATLPLMVLQFLMLMLFLNFIFYKPIIKVLDQRDDDIRTALTIASSNLLEANSLASSYESQLAEARKNAQIKIEKAKKEAQKLIADQLQLAQKEAEGLIAEASNQLELQKKEALKSLESHVDTLSERIKAKLLIF